MTQSTPPDRHVPRFLRGEMNRECVKRLLKDDHPSTEDMITALQMIDRLALEFELALGDKLIITRTGVGEYRTMLKPRQNCSDSTLDVVKEDEADIIDVYQGTVPVRPVDVLDTELSKYHNTIHRTEQ